MFDRFPKRPAAVLLLAATTNFAGASNCPAHRQAEPVPALRLTAAQFETELVEHAQATGMFFQFEDGADYEKFAADYLRRTGDTDNDRAKKMYNAVIDWAVEAEAVLNVGVANVSQVQYEKLLSASARMTEFDSKTFDLLPAGSRVELQQADLPLHLATAIVTEPDLLVQRSLLAHGKDSDAPKQLLFTSELTNKVAPADQSAFETMMGPASDALAQRIKRDLDAYHDLVEQGTGPNNERTSKLSAAISDLQSGLRDYSDLGVGTAASMHTVKGTLALRPSS